MLQACGEEMVMTAVNSVSFYFHTTDITLMLRQRQGFPRFHVATVHSHGQCCGIKIPVG